MEPNERQPDDQNQTGAGGGVRALLDCLSFLQDLEVQIADDPNRMEEMEASVRRRDLLLPCTMVNSNIGESSIRRIIELMQRKRVDRVDRILQAQRVIQEIIRDFEKSDEISPDDLDAPEAL